MPRVTVERTYLELVAPTDWVATQPKPPTPPTPPTPPGVTIRRESPCSVATYRELYDTVGRGHFWRDRLAWSDARLEAHLARPEVSVWLLRDARGIGGYFELERHDDGSVEIAYFGLFPSHHGRGLGKLLLGRAIEEGWRLGARRLWVHTCTLDGPAAMPNYLARGFIPYKQETYEAELG